MLTYERQSRSIAVAAKALVLAALLLAAAEGLRPGNARAGPTGVHFALASPATTPCQAAVVIVIERGDPATLVFDHVARTTHLLTNSEAATLRTPSTLQAAMALPALAQSSHEGRLWLARAAANRNARAELRQAILNVIACSLGSASPCEQVPLLAELLAHGADLDTTQLIRQLRRALRAERAVPVSTIHCLVSFVPAYKVEDQRLLAWLLHAPDGKYWPALARMAILPEVSRTARLESLQFLSATRAGRHLDPEGKVGVESALRRAALADDPVVAGLATALAVQAGEDIFRRDATWGRARLVRALQDEELASRVAPSLIMLGDPACIHAVVVYFESTYDDGRRGVVHRRMLKQLMLNHWVEQFGILLPDGDVPAGHLRSWWISNRGRFPEQTAPE